MSEKLNINDDVKVLKLNILKDNLKQNWNLDTDIWNEEFPHDFRFEDTYLQLSFILRDFNIDELTAAVTKCGIALKEANAAKDSEAMTTAQEQFKIAKIVTNFGSSRSGLESILLMNLIFPALRSL